MQDYFHKYQNAILIQPKMNEWNITLMILIVKATAKPTAQTILFLSFFWPPVNILLYIFSSLQENLDSQLPLSLVLKKLSILKEFTLVVIVLGVVSILSQHSQYSYWLPLTSHVLSFFHFLSFF